MGDNNNRKDHAEEDDETRLQIRKELAELSFEELQALKEKVGTKVYSQMLFDQPTKSRVEVFQRLNKNRPREESSKQTVGRFREVIPVKKKIKRDPRFDDLSGTFNERLFRASYSFVNDIKAKEKEELKNQLAKEDDPKRKRQIHNLLKRLDNQEREEKLRQTQIEKKNEQRKEIINQLRKGQKPHFIKKSTSKTMNLIDKYEELKKSKKLDKYLIRKRKKMSKKEISNI